MVALMAFALVMPMVSAEEIEVETAGIGPDSAFYGLDNAMERVRLAFTFGKANKARLKMKYAEERLAEVEDMIGKNKFEFAERARLRHNSTLEEVEELVDEIETNGDEETAEEALKEVERMQLRMLNHSERVAFVHNRILERLGNNSNVSSEQLAHLEEVFAKIEAKAQEMEQKMAQRRKNVRTRYKVLSGKNESELTEREEAFLERFEEAREEKEQLRLRIRERVKNKGQEFEVEIELESEEDDDAELEIEIELEDESEDEVECVVDADCEEGEFCDSEGECEDLEEESEDDNESQGNQSKSGQ